MSKIIFILAAIFLFNFFILAQGNGGNNPQPPPPGAQNGGGYTPPGGWQGGQAAEMMMLTFEPNINDKLKGYVGKEITLNALLKSISGQTNCRLRLETLASEYIVIATSQSETFFDKSIGRTITVTGRVEANGEIRFIELVTDEDDDSIKDLIELNQQNKIADVPQVEQKEFNFTALLLATTKERPAQQVFNDVEEEIIAFIPIYAAKIREINSRVNQQDATAIAQAILVAAYENDIDARLLFALIQRESRFNKNAVSSAGAQGLGQLMPGTAKDLGVKNSFDIEQNVNGAASYIAKQLKAFDNDITKALAAYNAGPARVRAANGVPNIRETRDYVQIVWREYKKLCGQ